jgi:hypothetical protein
LDGVVPIWSVVPLGLLRDMDVLPVGELPGRVAVRLDATLMSMLTLDECDFVDRQIVDFRPRIDGQERHFGMECNGVWMRDFNILATAAQSERQERVTAKKRLNLRENNF